MPANDGKYLNYDEQGKNTFVFECRIRVSNNESSFPEIRRVLSSSIRNAFPEEFSNNPKLAEDTGSAGIINRFILRQLKYRFESRINADAYLADYQEASGSFLISFTVLVFGAFTNYGSIRETLDYFIEDLEKLFTEILPDEEPSYRVSAQAKSSQSKERRINNKPAAYNQNIDNILARKLTLRTNISISLSVISIIILLLFFAQNIISPASNSDNKEPKLESQALDRDSILKMISDEFRNQRIDEHIRSRTDTVYVIKRGIK